MRGGTPRAPCTGAASGSLERLVRRIGQGDPSKLGRRKSARSPLARWAQASEVMGPEWRWSEGDPTLLLGRYRDQLVGRAHDDRHIVTVAGSRAGKGRSLILPNLAMWPGSVVVIDPKGELARKTARWREEGLHQRVAVLDPYGISGCEGAAYNPLDDLDPDSKTFLDDVGLIADALIMDDPKDRHWTDGAKNLIRTLILWMIASGEAATLPRLRAVMLGSEGKLVGRPRRASFLTRLLVLAYALEQCLRWVPQARGRDLHREE